MIAMYHRISRQDACDVVVSAFGLALPVYAGTQGGLKASALLPVEIPQLAAIYYGVSAIYSWRIQMALSNSSKRPGSLPPAACSISTHCVVVWRISHLCNIASDTSDASPAYRYRRRCWQSPCIRNGMRQRRRLVDSGMTASCQHTPGVLQLSSCLLSKYWTICRSLRSSTDRSSYYLMSSHGTTPPDDQCRHLKLFTHSFPPISTAVLPME